MSSSDSVPPSLLKLVLARLVTVPVGPAWRCRSGWVKDAPIPQELKDAYVQSLTPIDVDALYATGQTAVLESICQHVHQYRHFYVRYYKDDGVFEPVIGNTVLVHGAWMRAAAKRQHWDVAIFHLERTLQQPTKNMSPLRYFFEAVGEGGLSMTELPSLLQRLKESSVWLYPQQTLRPSHDNDDFSRYDSIRGCMCRGYIKGGHASLLPSHYEFGTSDVMMAAHLGHVAILDRVDLTDTHGLTHISYALATTPAVRQYLHDKNLLHECPLYFILCGYWTTKDVQCINRILCLLEDLRDDRVDCPAVTRDDLRANMGTVLAAVTRDARCYARVRRHVTEYIQRHNLSVDFTKELLDLRRDDVPLYNCIDMLY